MLNDEDRALLNDLRLVRQRNIGIFYLLAQLGQVSEFVPRKPGALDTTLRVIEAALEREPVQARLLLRKVIENDLAVIESMRKISDRDDADG